MTIPPGYRFPVDPTVKPLPYRPVAPDGHPRRCQGKKRSGGTQCQRYALKGRRFCAVHGGRIAFYHVSQMSRYSKQVSKSLASKLEELAGEPFDKRASIADEVDISRMLVERSLKLYDICHTESNTQVTPEQKNASATGLKNALATTTELVEKLVDLNSKMTDKVTINQIGFIVVQVSKIIDKYVKDEDVRDKIQKEIALISILDEEVDPRIDLKFGV